MKLEEGMYVRTKDGFIDKVIIEYKGCCSSPYCNCKHVSCKYNYYDEDTIIKASHNLIDLIEVGDYVNGYYVEDVKETFVNIATGSNYFQRPTVFEDDIKSIVTKEQFESMSYKVVEE